MGAISNMTVISNDGASELSKNVTSGVQQTVQMLKDATGFDVIEMLTGFGKSTGSADASAGKSGPVKQPAGSSVVLDGKNEPSQ